MDIKRHIQIFDLIAPVYSWFFSHQVRTYRRIIANHPAFLASRTSRIMDIGCGTGALAFVLAEHGHQVTGLDGSARMIALARRLNRGNQARFLVGNALELMSPQVGGPDISADGQPEQYEIVVASYVLHGLQEKQRLELYKTMKRLASERVIIMDYNQRRGLLTSLVEWLEHGDYFNFIKAISSEMQQNFPSFQIIQTGKRSAWYICECAGK